MRRASKVLVLWGLKLKYLHKILLFLFTFLLLVANLVLAYLECWDYGYCDSTAENTCNSWCNNRGLDCAGWYAYSSWCSSGQCYILYTIICSDMSWGRWTCVGNDWNCQPK